MKSKASQTANKEYRTSLTGKMWFFILILSLVCVLVFFIFTNLEFERTEKENAAETINSISSSVMSQISTYKDISRLIMIQDDVVKYLRSDWADPNLKYNARLGIMDVLNACRHIDSVFIIRNDGNYVSTGHGRYLLSEAILDRDSWPESILAGRGRAIDLINGEYNVYREDGETLITIGRAIYDIDSQEQTGLLLMNISAKMLSNLDNASGSNVCICTADGIPLTGDIKITEGVDIESFGNDIQHIKLGTKRFTSGMKMESLPLVIICRSRASFTDVPRDILMATALAFLVFLFCFFTLGAFLTKTVAKPVRTFAREIEKAEDEGKLEKITTPMPDNEIGMLRDRYNSMIDHINELNTKQRDSEKEMQRAEIRILQEQIKPHFLYNSLETIGGMAIEEGCEDVRCAVEVLGNFYRNFLSNGAREIVLKKEIAIIRNYIAMQKLRYGDILLEEYDIGPDTEDCLVPKLILQPLIENSINHGARLKGELVNIRIKTWMEDGYIHLLVYDSGLGMPESTIKNILETVDEPVQGVGGFGLRETVKRIRYYNKEPDAVCIRSEEGEYTEIEIKLPCRFPGREEDANVQSHDHR